MESPYPEAEDDDLINLPHMRVQIEMGKVRHLDPLPTLPMVVEPTCRYEHGALEVQVLHYSMDRLKGAHKGASGERLLVRDNMGFRVALWRCPVCRYVEMFDPD